MFKKTSDPADWFEVYEIADNLFAFREPRHYENTIVSLVIGHDKAALIDTGCGIGNLRRAVEDVTDKPVVVINTHTHPDHIGSNCQFEEIAMFDLPLSRRVAEQGISHETLVTDILADKRVPGPWPPDFDPHVFSIPPFSIANRLKRHK
jgi:glyoxylase-like metal-dependent hydrolase (beta-lactamase superfamily II)